MTTVSIEVDENFAGKEYITRFDKNGTVYKTVPHDNAERKAIVNMIIGPMLFKIDVDKATPAHKLIRSKAFRISDRLKPLLTAPGILDECIYAIDEKGDSDRWTSIYLFKVLGIYSQLYLPGKEWELSLVSIRIIQKYMSFSNIARICTYIVLRNHVHFDMMFTDHGELVGSIKKLANNSSNRCYYAEGVGNISRLYNEMDLPVPSRYMLSGGFRDVSTNVYHYLNARFLAKLLVCNLDVEMNHEELTNAAAYIIMHDVQMLMDASWSVKLIKRLAASFKSMTRFTPDDKHKNNSLFLRMCAFLCHRVIASGKIEYLTELKDIIPEDTLRLIGCTEFSKYSILYEEPKPIELYLRIVGDYSGLDKSMAYKFKELIKAESSDTECE